MVATRQCSIRQCLEIDLFKARQFGGNHTTAIATNCRSGIRLISIKDLNTFVIILKPFNEHQLVQKSLKSV